MKMKPADYTVAQLLELRKNKMLMVNAEYQRGQVWSKAQQKRLIDSILRAYPIPLMYLHHIKTDVAGLRRDDFEIIDGQQRINALYDFSEGAFKLFDPVKDEAAARFPTFISDIPCPWGGKDFESLDEADRRRFLETKLPVVEVKTDDKNEARDLFIRLQAGMPLTAQEKRDAWPGNVTEFVLKVAGKPEIARYPGRDFFKILLRAKAGKGRGKFRQLAAQMLMLFLTRRWTNRERLCTIGARQIDDFYYQHLDMDTSSQEARQFVKILDILTQLLGDKKRKGLAGHEAIGLMLLVDTLLDDYTRSWEARLAEAFDQFRFDLAKDKKEKAGEFWLRYGALTQTASDRAETIQRRHQFFCQQMYGRLTLQLKDPRRNYGPLEREIVYYRDKKTCRVCDAEVIWSEADLHHVHPHVQGGPTTLENAVLVHRHCHPKGQAAVEFAQKFKSGGGFVEGPNQAHPPTQKGDDQPNSGGTRYKNVPDYLIPVIKLMRHGKAHTEAFKIIAEKLGVASPTVHSQCTRTLGINTDQFIDYVKSGHIVALMKERYPDKVDLIDQELGL